MEARISFPGGGKLSSDAKLKAICHRQQKPLDRRDSFGYQRPEFENHQENQHTPRFKSIPICYRSMHALAAFTTLSNVFWTCVSEEMVSTRSLSAAVKTDNSDRARKKTHAKCHSLNKKSMPKTSENNIEHTALYAAFSNASPPSSSILVFSAAMAQMSTPNTALAMTSAIE